MDCREIRNALPDLLFGGIAEKTASAVRTHIDACPSCRREHAASETVWSSLESPVVASPERLKDSVRNRIHGMLEREEAPGMNLKRLLTAFGFGLALALAAIFSLSRQVDLGGFAVANVASCVVWWVGLFMLAGCLIVGRYRLGGLRLGFAASTAAASAAFIMVGTYLCPKLELLGFWQTSLLGTFIREVAGSGASHLAFGFAYAVVPTFLVTLYFGRYLYGRWLRHGMLAAAGFLALMVPSLYIQCCFIPFSLALLLVGGVVLGGFSGTLAGLGLMRLYPRPAAP